MERRIPKEDIHKIKWTDLGDHAYHHWLHERGFAPEFDELCYKSADVILDKLSNEEKNMILRNKIKKDLQDHNHYGQIALMLIDMGHENLLDEVGLKPSNFTGHPELKTFTEIDLNTGEYEAPILSVKINTENTPKNKL